MQASFEYRGYQVSQEGFHYVAREVDPGFDGPNPVLRGSLVVIVVEAIDALWQAIETGEIPAWFSSWMELPTDFIDLSCNILRKENFLFTPCQATKVADAPSFAA